MLTLLHDTRYAIRALARSKAFSIAVLLTLSLAIVEVVVVLTVVDRVLLRPLPFTNSNRLSFMLEAGNGGALRLASYDTFRDWQAQSHTIEGLAFVRGLSAQLRTPEGPRRTLTAFVTPGFFSMLGARPLAGRVFAPDEEGAGRGDVAVLSHAFWQETFGGDRSIIGKRMTLDSQIVTVIGIMPPGVVYPTWAEIWRPIGAVVNSDPALRGRKLHTDSRVIALLRPNVANEAVISEMRGIQARLAAAYPDDSKDWTSVQLIPLRDEIVGDIRPQLLALGGAVLLVWLLVCVNVANLALARSAARSRELAVRAALGAGRGRLARAILTETVVLSLAAGVLGVALSAAIVRLIRAAAPFDLPRLGELTIDVRLLAYAAGLALVTGVLAGLAPAWRAGAGRVFDALRDARSSGTGGRRGTRFRSALTVAQVSLALMLLVGAALLLRSFRRLNEVNLGFDPEHLLAARIAPPSPKYDTPEAAAVLYGRVLDEATHLPGVRAAAFTNHLPLGGGWVQTNVIVPERHVAAKPNDIALYKTVSTGYLAALGVRLIRGRWFTDADMTAPGNAVIINDEMAKRYWPRADPVGHRVTIFRSSQGRAGFGNAMPSMVVGVVNGTRHFGAAAAVPPEVYVPYTREVWPGIVLMVRTTGDPRALIPTLRRSILSIESDIPLTGLSRAAGIEPMTNYVSDNLATRRYLTALVVLFAASALGIALIGIYGLTAYTVARRTPELGVRIALGALPRDVLLIVVAQGFWLAVAGAAAGAGGALLLTRLLAGVLYGTSPTDPVSFAVAPVFLVATAVLASLVPALRASRLDPTVAIRAEH